MCNEGNPQEVDEYWDGYDHADDIEKEENWDNDDDDDATYCLTPWGCLSVILDDYGINYSRITPVMGKHMVQDFMELMEKAGHVKYVSES